MSARMTGAMARAMSRWVLKVFCSFSWMMASMSTPPGATPFG